MLTRDSTFNGTVAGVPVSGTILSAFEQRDGRVRLRVRLPAPILTIRGRVDEFTVIVNADGTPQAVTAQQEPDARVRARLADTKLTVGAPGQPAYDTLPAPLSALVRYNRAHGLEDDADWPAEAS